MVLHFSYRDATLASARLFGPPRLGDGWDGSAGLYGDPLGWHDSVFDIFQPASPRPTQGSSLDEWQLDRDAVGIEEDQFVFVGGGERAVSETDSDDAARDVQAPAAPVFFALSNGRPNPDIQPDIDLDPNPAPPPVDQPESPAAPIENGRPTGSAPGTPQTTPPAPPPGTDNADFGRAPDAVPGVIPLTSYTSGGAVDSTYNVTIEFVGSWTVEFQTAFTDAADYLSSIILADLPDALVDGVLVDDITITAALEPIDGVGNVLGSAGPDALRTDGTFLPATGGMRFDIADAQNQFSLGNWETIVLHEMMHALGVGTIWSLLDLTTGSIAGNDLRFIGDNAIAAYADEFPGIASDNGGVAAGIPVETDGGPGTAGGHWDETLFDLEIMTGFVDTNSYVSVMTIASMEDLGYDTVFDDPTTGSDLSGPIPADPLLDLIA